MHSDVNMTITAHKARNVPFGLAHMRTDRDNEYSVLSYVTRHLQHALKTTDHNQMVRAIGMNINLWTVFSVDLAQPNNGLPDQTKAGLLSLAIYSIKQSHRVLSESASAASLIEINLRIMKGLRGDATS